MPPFKDAVSRLFEPATVAKDTTVIFTIEPLGRRWWIFHRSDGRSGGIFDDVEGAILQAKLDARSVQTAIIETVDRSGSTQAQRFIRGALAGDPDRPVISLVR